jgi:hypothetical protein
MFVNVYVFGKLAPEICQVVVCLNVALLIFGRPLQSLNQLTAIKRNSLTGNKGALDELNAM